MKILKINSHRLRNEAHYQFLLLVDKHLTQFPDVEEIVEDQMPTYREQLALEGQLVDAVKASEYTAELAEADKRVDRDVVGINAAVNSALHHFDPEVLKAAQIIELCLKSFRGNIEQKSYEEESAAVKILVNDLQTTYTTQVGKVPGLSAWVSELNNAQADFERIFLLRNSQLAARPQDKLKDVRKLIDITYRSIVDKIDAYGLVNGYDVTAIFVSELNREIEYFNAHNHHHNKIDIQHAVVDSIADQIYQGEPVVVLPNVYYEGKKLVFTVDYEVAYKNNNTTGTATLTVHGKGKFKGLKIVSFNIING
jgi:hypothetical protein